MRLHILAFLLVAFTSLHADELSHLNEPANPYYPHLNLPKLTTPQWVGESGVDAVVILSIDDMRDSAKYEEFLRPIIDRLKKVSAIDGAGQGGAVSIFANSVEPRDPQLRSWLAEGLSLETHTVDHPCPLLCNGDLLQAKSTYDRCVDQLASVPGNQPVAFRMPCCDSLNTPSPRFWTEIFGKQTAAEHFLAIDSSVFNIFTSNDPKLSEEITTRPDGSSRFRHYLPFPSFVNTIENYPYPYMIGNLCWEFPCVVPSDWEAQHVQKPNNPKTVDDLLFALDATVAKQGVMPIVFHPHGWIRNDQLVQFIDSATKKYGQRVKFLTFANCLKRLNTNLLDGAALRQKDGNTNDARLVDINQDGFMDVVRRENDGLLTRVWDPDSQRFQDYRQPVPYTQPLFAKANEKLYLSARSGLETKRRSYVWKAGWQPTTLCDGASSAIIFRDVDGDGTSEFFTSAFGQTLAWRWGSKAHAATLPFDLNTASEKILGSGLLT